jgi:hypothetical protein
MPLVQNPTLGGGQVAMLSTITNLTAAQIKALDTVPVVLVPAPGAGKLIVGLLAALVYSFGTVAYSTATDSLDITYANANGDDVFNQIVGLMTMGQSAASAAAPLSFSLIDILPGDDNSGLQIQTFGPGFHFGPIVTATLGAGGFGYAANDTGTITTGNGDATYKVLTVGAGGAVLTFQVTAAGTGCTVGNGVATATGGAQPGVGTGFTVNITAVQTGNGTLKVVTYYQIIAVP